MWLSTPLCVLLCYLSCHTPQSLFPFCSLTASIVAFNFTIKFLFSHLFSTFPRSTVCARLSVCLPCLSCFFLSLPQPFYVVSSLSFCLSQQSPERKRSWLTQFILRLSAWVERKLHVRNQNARSLTVCLIVLPCLACMQIFIHTHTHTRIDKNTVIESSPGKEYLVSGSDGRELRGKSLLISSSFLVTEQRTRKGRPFKFDKICATQENFTSNKNSIK